VYNNLNVDKKLIIRIEELIQLKSTVIETYFHKGELLLIDYIKLCIDEADEIKNSLPVANGDMEALNNLFRKYIYKHNEH